LYFKVNISEGKLLEMVEKYADTIQIAVDTKPASILFGKLPGPQELKEQKPTPNICFDLIPETNSPEKTPMLGG